MNLSEYTKKLRELTEGVREELRGLREDRSLSAEAKATRVREAQERYREAYARERAAALELLEMRRQTAFRTAHPVDKPGGDVQAEILKEQRRERVHRELTALWAGRGGGPTLEEYEAALASGDELRVEAMEVYGSAAIANEDMRALFSRRVEESRAERMAPEQRAALEELEHLERAKFELDVALNFMDQTSRELTSLSPAASDRQTVL